MATGDLCTVSDVKAFLDIPAGTTTNDALLQTLVTNASSFVNNMVNRNLLSASYTETRNGVGGDRLPFREYPVTAVASVAIDGRAIQPSTSPEGFGYVFDDTMLYLRCGIFPRGVQNVVIQYTAGYANTPADISQACVEIVAAKYKRRTDIHISGKSINGESVTFNQLDLPKSAASTLSNYARRYMA